MIANMMAMIYIRTIFTMVDDQDDGCYEYDDDENHDKGHDPLYDHDYDHNLGHDYDNGFDIFHLQYIYTSNGLNKDDAYDDDEHFDDNHDGHMDLVGPLQ